MLCVLNRGAATHSCAPERPHAISLGANVLANRYPKIAIQKRRLHNAGTASRNATDHAVENRMQDDFYEKYFTLKYSSESDLGCEIGALNAAEQIRNKAT